jgi:hypothetical protein
VITRSSVGPVRRIITVSDAEGYGKLVDDEQRDLQNRMADIQDLAARNAGLDRQQAFIQGTGDGSLVAWPPGVSELELLVDYLRELHDELARVNRTLAKSSRIRLRVAISAGLVEEAAQGITGQAVIRATLLANSDQLREALRRSPGRPLAVILDGQLYEDVVRTGRRRLLDATYDPVRIRDKYSAEHVAWITVPGSRRRRKPAAVGGSGGRAGPLAAAQPGPSGRVRRRWSRRLIVALIGAFGAVTAAAITVAPGLFEGSSGPSVPGLGSSAISVSSSGLATPTTSPPRPSTTADPGKLYKEKTDNHLGTDVFRDPMGDAVADGPVSIPFGTQVVVRCWAPNESGMGSINAFYLVETSPWKGEYAPANTFLNADTTGALDPDVPQCSTA